MFLIILPFFYISRMPLFLGILFGIKQFMPENTVASSMPVKCLDKLLELRYYLLINLTLSTKKADLTIIKMRNELYQHYMVQQLANHRITMMLFQILFF